MQGVRDEKDQVKRVSSAEIGNRLWAIVAIIQAAKARRAQEEAEKTAKAA
jgi:hypothetical protein